MSTGALITLILLGIITCVFLIFLILYFVKRKWFCKQPLLNIICKDSDKTPASGRSSTPGGASASGGTPTSGGVGGSNIHLNIPCGNSRDRGVLADKKLGDTCSWESHGRVCLLTAQNNTWDNQNRWVCGDKCVSHKSCCDCKYCKWDSTNGVCLTDGTHQSDLH